jgi:hypothetical protein
VDDQVGLADAVAQHDDLRREAVEADAPVAVLAEDHGLAVLQVEDVVVAGAAVVQPSHSVGLKMTQFW